MLDTISARSLHLHSLHSLLADLVSGQAVGLEGKQPFSLASVEARALLDWYRKNQGTWSKNVTVDILWQLLTAAEQNPPQLTALVAGSATPRTFSPKRVEIYRFGGVQEYDSEEVLTINLNSSLLLLEGHNGSGKTSILNAIVWCLTGKLYRAQRAPADGQESVLLSVQDNVDSDIEEASATSTLVCPVPPKAMLASLAGKPLPLGTWVAVTFAEEVSGKEFVVRRRMYRKSSGKPEIEITGNEVLHLDPIAFEVGTSMPGLLPHIRIGAESDLGKAIAELTGLAPLRLMVRHARRASERIKKDLIGTELSGAITKAEERFLVARSELAIIIAEHPKVAPADAASLSPNAFDAIARLKSAAAGVRQRQADAYADARSVLGEGFNARDAAVRKALDGEVVLAQAALAFSNIATLSSAALLNSLNKLDDDSLSTCETTVAAFRAEARELQILAANPNRESRMRLYVRVANWLRETDQTAVSSICSLCLQPYGEIIDPATGRPPKDHLAEALGNGKTYLEKTLAAWAHDAMGVLARDLPEALSKTMRTDLPATPADLLRTALINELFDTDAFKGVLAPLKVHATVLCNIHLAALPPFIDPPIDPTLGVEAGLVELDRALRRLDRAVAFARWRKSAQSDCIAAFHAIVGRPQEARTQAALHEQPLSRQVDALADIVRAASPSGAALDQIAAMQREIETLGVNRDNVARAQTAAEHLAELFPIGDLVEEQLETLRRRLDGETKRWMERLYRAGTAGTAPNPRRSAVDSAGKLDMLVERNGTLVSAEHIGNASFLRAYLIAFLIAFWQHVRDARGGLSLLILDDPQELLDPNNRLRLAETLGHLLAAKATLLVSTHDSRFAQEIGGNRRCQSHLDHRSVHGRNAKRPCTQLAPYISDLDRKRKTFEATSDDHEAARSYANEFRIFIEARLSDFFDQPAYAQPRKLMLGDLLNEMKRQCITAEGLSGPAFDALQTDPALQSGNAFLNLLNRVHHRDAESVTWSDVNDHSDAFDRVRGLILDAHDEYRRWLKRDLAPKIESPVVTLTPMQAPAFKALSRDQNLAAFSADDGASGGVGSGDTLSASWFADKALFVLCADTLGFAAPIGSVLIVECASSEVEDHRLVVALHAGRSYARRVLRSQDLPGRVVLAVETEDPSRRLPPVVLPSDEVQLHKVVGLLFTTKPFHPRVAGEAIWQPFHRRLTEICKVYRAHGQSGVPLVLDGQTVLGGASITANAIAQHRQRLVAVCSEDGDAYFKRVGNPLPSLPHLRMFESVGGLGDSRVIQMEGTDEGDTDLPRFASAREVIGVLYS